MKNLQKFPKPGKPVKKRPARVTIKEKDLQAMAEEYLDLLGVAYIRIPDALFAAIYGSSINTRTKAFISFYLKGLPDLTIFHPVLKIGIYPVVMGLEIKTEAGKMSKYQEFWRKKIGTLVAVGWDETKKKIDEFLEMKGCE